MIEGYKEVTCQEWRVEDIKAILSLFVQLRKDGNYFDDAIFIFTGKFGQLSL